MGLIRAAIGAATGVLSDQWKDYIYCDSLSADILVAKGHRRNTTGGNQGNDNVITNGSIISINNGQCMIIVESGKVVDLCAEPGQYKYDQSSEPSVFTGGDLASNVKMIFSQIGKRFSFGGEVGNDQRVYYFNTKEIIGNKYGSPSPIAFRIIDQNLGIDQDIHIRCFGEYSYRISNPILFYSNVCGNVSEDYRRSEIDSQLKTELMTALQPAFARIAARGIRYSELAAHTMEIADELNEALSRQWGQKRGIEVVSFGVSSVNVSEEDKEVLKRIQSLQTESALRNPGMAGAHLVAAQAEAMKNAANNAGGAAIGFMGMNLAGQSGGFNANNLYAMQNQQMHQFQQSQQAQQTQQRSSNGWKCECGHDGNTGKFCAECGKPRPADSKWKCPKCGVENSGKFCAECGTPKPAGEWTCECGQSGNKGKFCANCGKPRP